MQNSPFQSCAHFLEISSHTAFGSKWPDIPDRTANSNKQNKTVIKQWPPENPAEISIMSMTDAISWVEKDQHGTMLLDKPFFLLLMGMKCIQVSFIGTKDTEEN